MPDISEEQKLAYVRDAIIQLMHQTYMDLKKMAESPEIWDSSPEFAVTTPWQKSNMQSIFISIYDVPVETPPYNRAAFSQLILQYGIEADYMLIYPRFDSAYRRALGRVNEYRKSRGLAPYPDVETARGMPIKR